MLCYIQILPILLKAVRSPPAMSEGLPNTVWSYSIVSEHEVNKLVSEVDAKT